MLALSTADGWKPPASRRVSLLALVSYLAMALPCCNACSARKGTQGEIKPSTNVAQSNPSGPPLASVASVEALKKEPSVVTCQKSSDGADYLVGPGERLTSLAEVPWRKLRPGDSVRIRWRSEPYLEKILLSSAGTRDRPIRVCGVPGPKGERPVLDGRGAASVAGLGWAEWQGGGIIVIDYARGDDYHTAAPAFLSIEGFELRGARPGAGFLTAEGKPDQWGEGSAAICMYRGKHITLRGNLIHDNSNGIFALSRGGAAHLIEDLLVEGNIFLDNGEPDRFLEHSLYVQAARVTYQLNYFGRLVARSGGASLKDRSTGTIVRYNRFDAGSHAVDLVEPQEHYDAVKDDPAYDVAYVYGNVIHVGDSGSLVHFGSDNEPKAARKGPLYFYHNTVLIEAGAQSWRSTVIDLTLPTTRAHVLNNVLRRTGGMVGSPGLEILFTDGILELGVNWISAPWRVGHDNTWRGRATGDDRVVSAGDVSLDPSSFRLRAGSVAIDRAQPLDAALKDHPVQLEYVAPGRGRERRISGKAPDLGAFELMD